MKWETGRVRERDKESDKVMSMRGMEEGRMDGVGNRKRERKR